MFEKPTTGFYIAFEGGDYVGKTTQKNLLESRLASENITHVLFTKEPGGDPIAQQIRTLLLDPIYTGQILPITEAYLFASSRAQTIQTVILPALREGRLVVSDRTKDTSIAYQGGGRQMGAEKIQQINQEAVGSVVPDIVYYLDADPQAIKQRLTERKAKNGEVNRLDLEPLDFFVRARAIFLELARENPSQYVTLDALQSIQTIHEIIYKDLKFRTNDFNF